MASDSDLTEEYELFFKHPTPYSQWHLCNFTVNGLKYNCAEQFMMHQKAILFNDKEIAKEIMETKLPSVQKKLGRKVKNFNQKKWDENCFDIVKKGNFAKFTQNGDIKKTLFATYPKTLVEASPYDCIWGIGLSANNPKALNKSTWNGRNLLGYALTEVRDELMQKEGVIK